MALATKPFRADDPRLKSNNLWVGSLTTDTTESDLTELFGRYGDIDRITAYSARSFAFIYYRHVEEAVAAKEALQGANLNGSQIKIEYARPVCSYLFDSLGLYLCLSTTRLFLRILTPGLDIFDVESDCFFSSSRTNQSRYLYFSIFSIICHC